MGATLRTAALAVLAIGIVACGGDRDEAPLRASVEQSRGAQVRGLVYLVLANPSASDVTVSELALDDQRFEPVPPTARRVEIAAGTRRLLVPVPIGAARCTGSLPTPRVVADGEAVPIDADGEALLDRFVDEACERAALAREASIAFVPDSFGVHGDAVTEVVLRLDRRGRGEPVTVDAVGSNVIFTATADVPATLSTDDDVLEVPVVLDAQRCEPHALAESKKTFIFPIWVALGDRPVQYLELEVTGDARGALDRALHTGCAG